MNLTKQQKIFAGILGLAACALAVDKFFLGTTSPEDAAADLLIAHEPAIPASTPTAAPSPTTTSTPAPARAPAPSLPGPMFIPIADRLLTLAVPGETAAKPASIDAFRVPEPWGDPFAKQAPPEPPKETVRYDFKLAAILKNRADGSLIAAINGRAYRRGEVIDGCKIIELTAQSAVLFTPQGRRLELSLPTSQADLRVTPAGPD